METAPLHITQLFFHYLRETNWVARPWTLAEGDHRRELFDLIVRVPVPIYLGYLEPRHQSWQLGLWPLLQPMDATVRPSDEVAMAAKLAKKGAELFPAHVLGATIFGQGRQPQMASREFAQLGVVMVRANRDASWCRTDFVFAAEIDVDGNAVELWMFENFETPRSDPDPNPNPQFLSYRWFNLRAIADIPPNRQYQNRFLLELHCGQVGWRRRSEEYNHVGLGPVELDPYYSPQPVHFLRVVRNSTGRFSHATWVPRDPTETSGVFSRSYWICIWYSGDGETGCTAIIPHN